MIVSFNFDENGNLESKHVSSSTYNSTFSYKTGKTLHTGFSNEPESIYFDKISFKKFRKFIETVPQTLNKIVFSSDWSNLCDFELTKSLEYCQKHQLYSEVLVSEINLKNAKLLCSRCDCITVEYKSTRKQLIQYLGVINNCKFKYTQIDLSICDENKIQELLNSLTSSQLLKKVNTYLLNNNKYFNMYYNVPLQLKENTPYSVINDTCMGININSKNIKDLWKK